MNRTTGRLVLMLMLVGTAGPAAAKPHPLLDVPPPDPDVLRQGGDTFADAFLLVGDPVTVTGSTSGYTDIYDEACPFTGSTSPDVVYRFTPTHDNVVRVDMLGSDYDTKIYVYGAGMELVACNDDYYADYTSLIADLTVEAGTKYYIVVDGYGGSFGDYTMTVASDPPYEIDCSDWFDPEGEPPLQDGYIDAFNGGCTHLDQGLNIPDLSFNGCCGASGWYDDTRDEDWFRAWPLDWYGLGISLDVEQPTQLHVYTGADCGNLSTVVSVVVEPGVPLEVFIDDFDDQHEYWLRVHPDQPAPPGGFEGHEYTYLLYQVFPVEPVIRVEGQSWTAVKALFE